MKTGQLIKELRIKKGITQEVLAAKTDISVRTIQRIESGEVDPRAYTLQSIAAALEVDFEVFTNGEELHEAKEKENNTWLPLLHLSGLLLLVFPPIILWIWKRDDVKDIRKHGTDVINFQLSMFLYLVLFAVVSAFPIVLVLGLYSQIIIIVNTVRVTNNQSYKYYLSIKFLKAQPVEVSV
jgi:transcriptional regulator with XRE-family HTH domain